MWDMRDSHFWGRRKIYSHYNQTKNDEFLPSLTINKQGNGKKKTVARVHDK